MLQTIFKKEPGGFPDPFFPPQSTFGGPPHPSHYSSNPPVSTVTSGEYVDIHSVTAAAHQRQPELHEAGMSPLGVSLQGVSLTQVRTGQL